MELETALIIVVLPFITLQMQHLLIQEWQLFRVTVSAQSTIQNWGPYLGFSWHCHNDYWNQQHFGQFPESRRDALLDALVTLKGENTRSDSPLLGQLDVNSLAVGGWSMGGGGAQLAAVAEHIHQSCLWLLCPWLKKPEH